MPLSKPIELKLPVPLSVNRYWRSGAKNGVPHVYLSDEARNYKHTVHLLTRHVEPFAGPVVLQIIVFREYNRGDIDNYLKGLLDSLQGNVYKNDAQIIEIHLYKRLDRNDPRVELTAWEEQQ